MKRTLAIIVVSALAGCTAPNSSSTAAQSNEIRLRGDNAGQLQAVLVDISDLKVSAAGRALDVRPGQQKLDLARTDNAWLVGSFTVPAGVDQVHVTLTVDDYGGFVTAGDQGNDSGFIDARHAALDFDAPLVGLALHHQATVRLDLARSLPPGTVGTRTLIPKARVLY